MKPVAPLRQWLRAFWPEPMKVDRRERWRAIAGAGFGMLLTALLGRWWLGDAAHLLPWLVAPMGASAVLVFAVPASPLAQPWSVVGGNTLSALVGIACVRLIDDTAAAAAVAVALAIATMFLLRCLHPPGGAMALFAVMAPVSQFGFAAAPVLLDSTLLVFAGLLFNNLTGRRYPHFQVAAATTPTPSRFTAADLDTALAHYNQVLDISRDDLEGLLHQAEAAAYQRNLGELRCADIMTPSPVTVGAATSLEQAWALLQSRRIKALPVTDRNGGLVGIVTAADFVRASGSALPALRERLRSLAGDAAASGGSERVSSIMTRRVRVASAQRRVTDLLPLFSDEGHHHIPVVDESQRLVGIVTQSDFVRALHRAVQPPG